MNAERLHSVLRTLAADNEQFGFVALVNAVETAYTGTVQAPDAPHADAFKSARDALLAAVQSSGLQKLSPTRRGILETIGGKDFVDGLANVADEIIRRGPTPADAVTELGQLRARVTELLGATKTTLAAFKKLNIPPEEEPEDQAEIELRMPESLVDGSLGGLGDQASKLDRIIGDIGETATGSRPTVKLRSLGSGSVDIGVLVDPVTGAAVLKYVTAIVTLINQLLAMRKRLKDLREEKAPPKLIEEHVAWERKIVDDKIAELRKEMIDATSAEKSRANELQNALARSLPQLADEIDRGLDVDVTIKAPEAKEEAAGEGPPAGEPPPRVEAIKQIQANTGSILKLDRDRQPVLLLTAGENAEGQPSDDQGQAGQQQAAKKKKP
jgi:hypothetical protein